MAVNVHQGDCLEVLRQLHTGCADLVYLDPPFFTQRKHSLNTRDRTTEYSFDDRWNSISEYSTFLHTRVKELHRILKSSGSVFFHCDKTASHIARTLLDEVFHASNFRAEIIWHYRRWSNSARNLLPAHQTILFYSKTKEYKFNIIRTEYSPTTNVDQILQRRSRDSSNKSIYARDENGYVVFGGSKKGVPLSDVWEIPFLNPKAKERTGYPTQKPILLLERIIELVTDAGDLVVDPFCGSGTTLVAAQMLNRSAFGIDVSQEAVELTKQRLKEPIRTESNLLKNGIDSYRGANESVLALLNGIPHTPVHRNKGIDAFLEATYHGVPIPVRVQRSSESLDEAARALYRAGRSKKAQRMLLIVTEDVPELLPSNDLPKEVLSISSASLSIRHLLAELDTIDKTTPTTGAISQLSHIAPLNSEPFDKRPFNI